MGRSSTERLVSTVRHHRGGRWVEPGQTFDATPLEADALVRAGWARRAEAPAPSRREYQRRDLEAESGTPSSRRSYKRRDLEAES